MEKILILDFGSQYTQLIARRVRELNVYCEIHPFNKIPAIDASVRGVILSGSPFSVRDAQAPTPDLSAIKGKLPLLGVCYGAQFLASAFGGEVQPAPSREYGRAMLTVGDASDALMRGLPARTQVWMSHGDTITRVPDNYELIASTEDVRVAAFHVGGEQTWGIQFHPEVYHSTDGTQLLKNFVVDICGCGQSWTSEGFVEATVRELREKLGDDKVVLALSGGVDSSVAAVLLHKAIGKNLYCVFVDSGLLRKNEFGEVLESYKHMGLNVKGVNASAKFLGDLAGVTDPERKRKIIGRDFVEVFNEEAIQIKDVKWLAQGTIYPDVIESCSVNGPSATIKSHHNVGGLPEKMNLKIVEPLRLLFKDEVRQLGRELGLPEYLVMRQPFPGPGLAIRVIGDITKEKLDILREADFIFRDEIAKAGLEHTMNQYFAVLTNMRSVGVMGDGRTYDYTLALRSVTTTDFMTADWARIPYDVLDRISVR
uniref:glutamine-hydrolyzing GMP synthase n=1 Tax=Alistipes shahii TaxID=328814 RepID=UPI003FF0E770